MLPGLKPEWSDRKSTGVPLEGLIDWFIGSPTPITPMARTARMTFFYNFLDYFFKPLSDRFWCQLGPNLASKIDQKSIREPSKIYSNFYLVLSTFSNWCLMDFGSTWGHRTLQLHVKKSFWIFLWFCFFAFWIAFEANLAPFWEELGSQVGTKLASNRSKNRSQKCVKT